MYRWQGAVVREAEQLLLLKTPDAAWPRLEERIRELHPYEVPELVAVPAARVADGYLAWLLDSTSMTEV
jgi:periplasmic divalent cation tolerance protein